MLLPPEFEQQSISTNLGEMVYATEKSDFWHPDVRDSQLPSLVFLHGFGGGSSNYEWSKVYPAFAHDYRILAPDLIGWGRSVSSPRHYQVEDYLTTITEFIEKTCNKPATIIASSLTAAFVVRIATVRPELFETLILVAPAGLLDFGKNNASGFLTQLVSAPVVDRLIYYGVVANEFAIRGFLENQQFARPERVCQEIVQAYLMSAQQPNADYSALSFVGGNLSFDLSPYFAELKTPTALFWGKCARFTKPELGCRFAEINDEAVKLFQILDDVGLTPQLELPAMTIGLIRKSLKYLNH